MKNTYIVCLVSCRKRQEKENDDVMEVIVID